MVSVNCCFGTTAFWVKEITKVDTPKRPDNIENNGCSRFGQFKTIMPSMPEMRKTKKAHEIFLGFFSFSIMKMTTATKR